ncbi:MAG TPA: hypothetical protein VK081_03600 [Planctomycetota bacterium]|nr:hypothetical protein [Planctomycetota bacterium]
MRPARALQGAVLAALAAAPGAQDRASAPARAGEALAAAWLSDLLGDPPEATLAAYRVLVEDENLPREHRLRAAARALPAAASAGGEEGSWWAARFLALVPGPRTFEPDVLLARLAAQQEAARAWAASDREVDNVRPLLQRLAGEPYRTLETMASRPLPAGEAAERLAGAAERRRGRAALARPRAEAAQRHESEPQRPRTLQLRRWARDALEWELAGDRAKSERLLDILARRRGVRGPATVERLEQEVAAARGRRLAPGELALVERALDEARRRAAAGDDRGVAAVVGPALALLLMQGE